MELLKHRDAVYELVREGKLPTSESAFSAENLENMLHIFKTKISENSDPSVKKCSENSFKVLIASYVDESEIKIWVIPLAEEEASSLPSVPYFIETGNQQFLTEIVT